MYKCTHFYYYYLFGGPKQATWLICASKMSFWSTKWLNRNENSVELYDWSLGANVYRGLQRICINTEVTATSFVFTESVFCLRKPETIEKTTPAPVGSIEKYFFSLGGGGGECILYFISILCTLYTVQQAGLNNSCNF